MPLVTYSDGDTYNGDIVGGLRHGQGTYTWANGNVYSGTWADGDREGQGTFTWSGGAVYSGAWVDNAKTGEGTKTSANGDVYEGTWVDNYRDGQGTLSWVNGNVYVGAFVDAAQTGEGTKTWADGASYTGTFVDGVQTGEGTLTWASGDTYTGAFVDGARTGEGTYTWANGDVYTGAFVDGVASGGTTAGEIPYFVSTETVEKTKTGITTTDALLYGSPKVWANNNTYDNGSSTTITYSFSGTSDLYLFDDDYTGPDPKVDNVYSFSAVQQAAARLALKQFSDVADLTFVEVAETAAEVGTIRFGFTDQPTDHAAWGYTPGLGPSAGDIWFASGYADQLNTAFERGSDHTFKTLLHEIGHALGLDHPFGGDDTLTKDQDFINYTLMSYTEPDNHSYYDADGNYNYAISFTPMVYDIAAIQHLYGAAVHNTGDTVYKYDPAKPFVEAIWDSGGTDTLDLSDFTKACTISLVPGAYLTIVCNDWTMTDNLGIAFGAVIEKAIGGSGDDIITGNSANNTLHGNAGDDTLTGGTGSDTLVGGLGADRFVYVKGDGNDVIINFEEGVDQISYTGFTAAEQAKFTTSTADGGDTLITLTDGSTLLKRAELAEQHDLTGTVLSCGGGALSDVVVTADLSDANWQVTDTSAATGKFGLKIDSGSNLKLLTDMTHTNASPTNAITAEDALEALRLSIGLNKTDGSSGVFDYMAADFNKDGKVTPQDALDIHKYALGLGDLTADWVFVDSTGDYSDITKANAAFTEGVSVAALSANLDIAMTGILLGDVNDTYADFV